MDNKEKPLKPDKLALKTKLFKDRDTLLQCFMNATDVHDKILYKGFYEMVDSYIEICTKRNKF